MLSSQKCVDELFYKHECCGLACSKRQYGGVTDLVPNGLAKCQGYHARIVGRHTPINAPQRPATSAISGLDLHLSCWKEGGRCRACAHHLSQQEISILAVHPVRLVLQRASHIISV